MKISSTGVRWLLRVAVVFLLFGGAQSANAFQSAIYRESAITHPEIPSFPGSAWERVVLDGSAISHP